MYPFCSFFRVCEKIAVLTNECNSLLSVCYLLLRVIHTVTHDLQIKFPNYAISDILPCISCNWSGACSLFQLPVYSASWGYCQFISNDIAWVVHLTLLTFKHCVRTLPVAPQSVIAMGYVINLFYCT